MRAAFDKIATGLKEALAIARGEKKPARVTIYSQCQGCGNLTRTDNGRCIECREPKPTPTT